MPASIVKRPQTWRQYGASEDAYRKLLQEKPQLSFSQDELEQLRLMKCEGTANVPGASTKVSNYVKSNAASFLSSKQR